MIGYRNIFGIYISALVLASGASAAESVGIPACDDTVKRYENCLASHTPPEEQAAFRQGFNQQVGGYAVFLAKDATAKAKVRAACERHLEATKNLGGNTDCHISPLLVFQSPFLSREPKTR